MNILKRIALALVIIGAINWGLIGFFRFDLVAALFGGQTAFLARIIYGLVGLSGLYCLTILFDPMGEKDAGRDNFAHNRNLNYGTEYGEETDFSSVEKQDRDL